MSKERLAQLRTFTLPDNLHGRLTLLRYRQEDTSNLPLLEEFRIYTSERDGVYSFVAVDEKPRPHPLLVTGTYFDRRSDATDKVNAGLEREAFSEVTKSLVQIAWRRLYPSRWQQLLNRHRLAIKTAVAVAIASAALVIFDAVSPRMNIFSFVNALCARLGDFGAKNVGMITGCIRLFFVLAATSLGYWIAGIIGARRHPILSVEISDKTLRYCYGAEAFRVIEDVEKGIKQTCIPAAVLTAATPAAPAPDVWRGYDNFVSYDEFQKRVRLEAKRASRFAEPVSCLIVSLEPVLDDAGAPVRDVETPVREKCTQVMWHEIREIDTAARYGDNGFIVLLPNTDAKGAQTVEKRLRSKLESCNVCKRCIAETAAIRTGTSAVAPTKQGLQWDEIIRQAESALLTSSF